MTTNVRRTAARTGGAVTSIAAAAVLLTACGSGNPAATDAAPGNAKPPVTTTAPGQPTRPAKPAPTKPAERAPTQPAQPAPAKPVDDGSFTMPNLVGTGLQDAQDRIQQLSGNPFFYTDSTDATGQGRMQILDSDWKVVSQNVAPGTKVNQDTNITFSVVKVDESYPTRVPSESDTRPAADGSFIMPNEVGKTLQEAQDHIQQVSGNPFFYTDSTDATGAGRMQILDSDWKVVSQNVAPGTKVNQDTDITFSVVKVYESYP